MLHCILMAGSSFVSTKREKHSENRHRTPFLFRGGLSISGNDWLREVVIDNTERDCTSAVQRKKTVLTMTCSEFNSLRKKIRCAENFSKRHSLCKHKISPLPHPTPPQKNSYLSGKSQDLILQIVCLSNLNMQESDLAQKGN